MKTKVRPLAFRVAGKYWVNNHAHCVDAFDKRLLAWLEIFVNSLDISNIVRGTAQPKLNQAMLNNFLVPMPSFAEQFRIADALGSISSLIEEYGEAQERRVALDKALPSKLRASVLQAAVEGKLVPQRAEDGSGAELLERIRAERARLVEEGKAKPVKGGESVIYRDGDGHWFERRGKHVPVCIDEEILYEVPESWTQARMSQICTKIVDGDHNPPQAAVGSTPYLMLSAANIQEGTLSIEDRVRYLSEADFIKSSQRISLVPKDILLTIVGTIGRSVILGDWTDFCLQRSVAVLHTVIDEQYLKAYLDSPQVQSYMQANASGTAQKGFYLKGVQELLVPVPPLPEQHRIVTAIQALQQEIEGLPL